MDSNASQPAFKVVGFHVEGVPPSPDHATLLQDALISGGGSPDPVIIPPSFQASLAFIACTHGMHVGVIDIPPWKPTGFYFQYQCRSSELQDDNEVQEVYTG